jgi:hypothetical protein
VDECATCKHLHRIVLQGLKAGRAVEIEGMGTFYPDAELGVRFEPPTKSQVFIAYVKEDEAEATRLFNSLAAAGFNPWMDIRKLLPGQNWPRAIETAIETSDFFVACFSRNSVRKKGGFQAEIRYALDCARQIPLDQIFIVPVRLDSCKPPREISHEIQYIDFFPDRKLGLTRLIAVMRRDLDRRMGKRVPPEGE